MDVVAATSMEAFTAGDSKGPAHRSGAGEESTNNIRNAPRIDILNAEEST